MIHTETDWNLVVLELDKGGLGQPHSRASRKRDGLCDVDAQPVAMPNGRAEYAGTEWSPDEEGDAGA